MILNSTVAKIGNICEKEYDKAYRFRNYSMYTVHGFTDLHVKDTSSHLKSTELTVLENILVRSTNGYL